MSGVTGAKKELPVDLHNKLKIIKSLSKKPVFVGFGISTATQVKQVSKTADGVIIGSAIIRLIKENYGKKTYARKISHFIRSMKNST